MHPRPTILALVVVLIAPSAGCAVRARVGGVDESTGSPASAPTPPPPPRPEGFDEVRGSAPLERIDVDPQAAFLLRQGAGTTRDLPDRTTPTGLTSIALLDTTRTEARGLVPEGGLREVTLGEGERAAAGFDLGAGECLTVIAHGGLGVREVDAFVVVGSDTDGDILAQDETGGPVAVVGGRAGCTRTLKPERVRVVVQVRKGQGTVVTAIYRGGPATPKR